MSNEQKLAEARTFLNDHFKAVFTVLDRGGAPSSSLMHYVIDEDFNLYIATKRSFGKYSAMKNDARVSFAVIEESADPLVVVDMQGTAEEIPEEKTAEMYGFFKSKNDKKHYVQGAEDLVMFKIVPSTMRFMDARSGDLSITDLIGRQ